MSEMDMNYPGEEKEFDSVDWMAGLPPSTRWSIYCWRIWSLAPAWALFPAGMLATLGYAIGRRAGMARDQDHIQLFSFFDSALIWATAVLLVALSAWGREVLGGRWGGSKGWTSLRKWSALAMAGASFALAAHPWSKSQGAGEMEHAWISAALASLANMFCDWILLGLLALANGLVSLSNAIVGFWKSPGIGGLCAAPAKAWAWSAGALRGVRRKMIDAVVVDAEECAVHERRGMRSAVPKATGKPSPRSRL